MTGVYIHVPFCLRKCVYCDFYSVKYSASDAEYFTEAVIRNLKRYDITADTVYFGGGTPTLLSPKQVSDILSCIGVADGAEITMECNPKTADRETLRGYKAAGVNRISVGVQSLNGKELEALGRLHSPSEALRCIEDVYSAGTENISADIMLGIPYQTDESLRGTLRELIGQPVTHISAYMLKVEEGTPLSRDKALLENIADGDRIADIYLAVCDILKSAGFERYEISNFSKRGCECRHNLKYWRCEDYIGIGPAAHSCYGGKRFAVPSDISDFILSETQKEYVTDDAPCGENERIMLGLRLSEGISPDDFSVSEQLKKRAAPLITAGFITEKNGRLSLTDKGALVSNEIITRLTV